MGVLIGLFKEEPMSGPDILLPQNEELSGKWPNEAEWIFLLNLARTIASGYNITHT